MAAWKAYSYNHVHAHLQYLSKESVERLAGLTGCSLAYWSHVV